MSFKEQEKIVEQDKILADFINYLQREKTYALNSLQAYVCDARQFAEFLISRFRNIEAIHLSHLEDFRNFINEKSLAERTVSRKIICASRFMDFCALKTDLKTIDVINRFLRDIVSPEKTLPGNEGIDSVPEPLDLLVSGFLQHLTHKKSSLSTLKSYSNDLTKLAIYLDNDLDRLDSNLNQYFAELKHLQLSPPSIKRKLASIRSFCGWLVRRGRIKTNPAQRVSLELEVSDRHRELVKEDEVELLRSNCQVAAVFPERESLILEMLYGLGLRPSDIVRLNIEDVDFTKEIVKIHKSGSEQFLPFPNAGFKRTLKRYVQTRSDICRSKDPRGGPLIVNSRGGRLTTRSLSRNLRDISRASALSRCVRPSVLRQAHVKHAISAGNNPVVIMNRIGLLGGVMRYKPESRGKPRMRRR